MPRPIRGSFWVSRCGRTGTGSVDLPWLGPRRVLACVQLLTEVGPAQRLGLSGEGHWASAAGQGSDRVFLSSSTAYATSLDTPVLTTRVPASWAGA